DRNGRCRYAERAACAALSKTLVFRDRLLVVFQVHLLDATGVDLCLPGVARGTGADRQGARAVAVTADLVVDDVVLRPDLGDPGLVADAAAARFVAVAQGVRDRVVDRAVLGLRLRRIAIGVGVVEVDTDVVVRQGVVRDL